MECKFCKTDTARKLSVIKDSPYKPFPEAFYTLYECRGCGNRFFDHNEHRVDSKKIYDEYAEGFNASNETQVFKIEKYWLRQVGRIEKLVYPRKINSVLDVGCRAGEFLLHFSPSIIREGVELSECSSKIARQRGLKIYSDYVENIDFKCKYDVVTCYAVLEHLIEPLKFLDKLSSLVMPGGVLVIMVPTFQCLKTFLIDNFTSKRWHMYVPPLHYNFFTRKYLDNYLAKNNFLLLNRYYTSGGMFVPFKNIPLLGRIFARLIDIFDESSISNIFPVFDHQYSYYLMCEK